MNRLTVTAVVFIVIVGGHEPRDRTIQREFRRLSREFDIRGVGLIQDPSPERGTLGRYDAASNTIKLRSMDGGPLNHLTLLHEVKHFLQHRDGTGDLYDRSLANLLDAEWQAYAFAQREYARRYEETLGPVHFQMDWDWYEIQYFLRHPGRFVYEAEFESWF